MPELSSEQIDRRDFLKQAVSGVAEAAGASTVAARVGTRALFTTALLNLFFSRRTEAKEVPDCVKVSSSKPLDLYSAGSSGRANYNSREPYDARVQLSGAPVSYVGFTDIDDLATAPPPLLVVDAPGDNDVEPLKYFDRVSVVLVGPKNSPKLLEALRRVNTERRNHRGAYLDTWWIAEDGLLYKMNGETFGSGYTLEGDSWWRAAQNLVHPAGNEDGGTLYVQDPSFRLLTDWPDGRVSFGEGGEPGKAVQFDKGQAKGQQSICLCPNTGFEAELKRIAQGVSQRSFRAMDHIGRRFYVELTPDNLRSLIPNFSGNEAMQRKLRIAWDAIPQDRGAALLKLLRDCS